MYLIHVGLRAPDGVFLPPDTNAIVMSCSIPRDGLEHISVHADAEGGPVLGLYLSASGLSQAEQAAAELVSRALAKCPSLTPFTMVTCGAALVPGPWWGAD